MKEKIDKIKELVSLNKMDEVLEESIQLTSEFRSIEAKIISIKNDYLRTTTKELSRVDNSDQIRKEKAQQVDSILKILNMIESKGLQQVDSIFLKKTDSKDSPNTIVSIAITISVVGGVAVLIWLFIDIFLVLLLVLLIGLLVATFFDGEDSYGEGDSFYE